MKWFLVFTVAAVLGVPALAVWAGPTGRFVELGAPTQVSRLGERVTLKLFSDAGEPGIKLHNASTVPVMVQDTGSLATLTVAPGMRIGLQCESARHLALSTNGAVVHEHVPCGSLLQISASTGGES